MDHNNPNAVQHGGDHYKKAGASQHWDMLPVFGYGWEYYVGRATAYLTRVKQPELDPSKASHFVDKLLWLIDHGLVPPVYRRHGNRTDEELHHYLATMYFPANNIQLRSREASAITTLMFANDSADLMAAKAAIKLIDEAANAPKEVPSTEPYAKGYVNQDQEKDDRVFAFGDSAIAASSRDLIAEAEEQACPSNGSPG